jgi:enamine deaminase RidA (YjgF/YER057c/UK114 family)
MSTAETTRVEGWNDSYALGKRGGDLFFLAGHVGSYPKGGGQDADFQTQVRRALDRMQNTLAGAGLTWADLVKVNVFLTSSDQWDAYALIYREYIDAPRPARTTVVTDLGHGWLFEIDGVAAFPR